MHAHFGCVWWWWGGGDNLPVWLMVKNYLLQYILLEATYLRSTCCIMGDAASWVSSGAGGG